MKNLHDASTFVASFLCNPLFSDFPKQSLVEVRFFQDKTPPSTWGYGKGVKKKHNQTLDDLHMIHSDQQLPSPNLLGPLPTTASVSGGGSFRGPFWGFWKHGNGTKLQLSYLIWLSEFSCYPQKFKDSVANLIEFA